jgi:hypothetical protein
MAVVAEDRMNEVSAMKTIVGEIAYDYPYME